MRNLRIIEILKRSLNERSKFRASRFDFKIPNNEKVNIKERNSRRDS